ncbi:MAG TPA: hypothetical protein ENK43_07060 [Planctomycetes bacterium]|nr:hypothetical protein [Planctomycetota bacterium]
MKKLFIALIIANVAFMGYNASRTWSRVMDEENASAVETAQNLCVKLRRTALKYRADLDRIATDKFERVDEPSLYFAKQARAAGFDPLKDGINIPIKTDFSKGSRFDEESWKVSFRKKDKYFRLKDVARFCQLVERDSPSFQIKSIDFGRRTENWGKDQWQPRQIVIRRWSIHQKT